MKFTYSWLKEHLDTDLSLAQLDEAMTMAGLEIEEIEDPGAKLAEFSTAYVKDAQPHDARLITERGELKEHWLQ